MEYHEGREFVATYMKPKNIVSSVFFILVSHCTFLSQHCVCNISFSVMHYYIEIVFCPNDPIRTFCLAFFLCSAEDLNLQYKKVLCKVHVCVGTKLNGLSRQPLHITLHLQTYRSTDLLHLRPHQPVSLCEEERSKF